MYRSLWAGRNDKIHHLSLYNQDAEYRPHLSSEFFDSQGVDDTLVFELFKEEYSTAFYFYMCLYNIRAVISHQEEAENGK